MDLVLGVVSFTGIVLLLVVVILLARSQLVASGNVSITINGDEENKLEVQTGSKLLQTLADNKIFLSSACGGGGTCSQCKCQILEVEDQSSQLKKVILMQKKRMKVGDYHVRLQLKTI